MVAPTLAGAGCGRDRRPPEPAPAITTGAAAPTGLAVLVFTRTAGFRRHPTVQRATVLPAPRAAALAGKLPRRWERSDEWYDFRANPRGRVRVLATVAESTDSGSRMGADHPIAWCQEYDGGRSWYSAMGHTSESFRDPWFLAHLLAGIRHAAGQAMARCNPGS